MNRNLALALSALIGLGFLPGCQTPSGKAAKDWGMMIRELQIIPVYPPREDIEVGDVYAKLYDTQDEENKALKKRGFLKIPRLLDAVDYRTDLEEFYATRFSFPESILIDDPINPGSNTLKEPSRKSGIFQPEDPRERLPIVAFPDYSYTVITSGSLNAVIPVDALSIVTGLTASNYESVSIKVRSSEYYGLPRSTLIGEFGQPDENSNSLYDRLKKIAGPNEKKKGLIVVQEVYMARDFDITANFKKSIGFGASVKPPGSAGGGSGTPGPNVSRDGDDPSNGESNGSAGSGNSGSTVTPTFFDPAAPADERMTELEKANRQLLAQSTSGGSIQITSVSDRSITMRRRLPRPVVIGIRAITLKYNDSTETFDIVDDDYSAPPAN